MLYLCQQGQMFVTGENMHAGRDQQPLSYATRLPNEAQQDALRLLDSSRSVVNAALIKLWPKLDAFLHERRGPAWKHVVELIDSPDPHGNRQWRCEAETAGRIMRGQAERKQVFALIQPILSHGFIRPKTEHRAAGKNRKSIKEAMGEDGLDQCKDLLALRLSSHDPSSGLGLAAPLPVPMRVRRVDQLHDVFPGR